MMIFKRLAARSISTCETPAPAKRFFKSVFSFRSSMQEFAKLLLRKPVRMPVFVVAEAKTVWMNFLTHNLLQFRLIRSSSQCF